MILSRCALKDNRVRSPPRVPLLFYRTSKTLSDEVQLGFALEAFAYAHKMGMGWASEALQNLNRAGIFNLSDLSLGCREKTVILDLELFGVPEEERLSSETIRRLSCFLPGPVGFRCLRLAQKAAEKVKKGTADTAYVHRPENGATGEEIFQIHNDEWIVKVDW